MAQSAISYAVGGLAGVGFASEQASALAVSLQSNFQALGSTIAYAATNYADMVVLTSVASNNKGFKLRPYGNFRRTQIVVNATSTAADIYPPSSSASINNQAPGASFSLASGLSAAFDAISSTQYWKR